MEPDAVEIRVLGCLIEKQRTTPDVYPLTLNALRLACNQSTNRDPVVDYDENTIRSGIERLVQRKWATLASWSNRRSMKYRHTLDGALGLDELGDLRARGADAARSADARRAEDADRAAAPVCRHDELSGTLARLIERRLVARLERRPGQREERYRQLLAEEVEAGGEPQSPPPPETSEEGRIERIERQLAELRAEVQALRDQLGA